MDRCGLGRERAVSELYVRLSDTLIGEYDVADFLQALVDGCKDVFDVDVVGVLLEKRKGELALSAASDEEMRSLDAFEIQSRSGPCYDAYNNREQVVVEDLEACRDRWPELVPKALDLGFRSGYAFPLRLRDDVIGALNMYRETREPFTYDDVHLAQSLANVASIGIINERTIRDAEVRAEQLQTALNSRVLIEQAKGALAEREGISPGEAFKRMRRYSRSNNMKLRQVCKRVFEEGLSPD